MFARLNRYARYAYAPVAALALWAVLLALWPAAADAQQTPRTSDRANAQDTAVRPAHRVVVAPGDSLWSITERQLGPRATGPRIARGVERIYALNRDLIGADPDLISVGQRFALPPSLERHGAERHASGQAREAARSAHARSAHAGAGADRPQSARTNRGAGSEPVRVTGPAADRSSESLAGRTTNVPVAAQVRDAREAGALPDVAPVAPVPAVGRPTADAIPSSPASYLGGVRATVLSVASRLIDAVVTDDRYAGRQLFGWALILISLGIGALVIVLATWPAVARRKREKRRRRRAARAYSAAVPVAIPAHPRVRERTPRGAGSARLEEPGRSENPAVSTQDENKGGSPPEGTRRSVGSASFRGGSAGRTKPRRTNKRRKMVGEDPKGPDRLRGWPIGEGLRHSLEGIPLRPDKVDDALADLKPLVEKELRSVALVERRRTLSDLEHRQADALRDLLALALHYEDDKR